LTFTLADASGQPIRGLMTHHGRKLHVLIVSADMEVFGHVHPQDFEDPVEDGEAKVVFTFPRAGRYLAAVDFVTEAGAQAAQFFVEVAGPKEPAAVAGKGAAASMRLVEPAEGDRYTDPVVLGRADEEDGYAVSLHKPDLIEAGAELSLVYRFTKDGAPVTDLRPFLAAPLHLALDEDDLSPLQL